MTFEETNERVNRERGQIYMPHCSDLREWPLTWHTYEAQGFYNLCSISSDGLQGVAL